MRSQRIKILYTIPNFNTAGSGRSVYDLVKGLDRSIFEPEVCCFHAKGAFYNEIEALGVKIHLFPFTTTYKPYSGFFFRVLKISRFFKSNQFDLIHSWHWSSDISEPLAAKIAGIPYVYTKKAMGWHSRFWKWRSRLSSKIIAVNKDMMKEYFTNIPHKVSNFPLAIDTKVYAPNSGTLYLRKELGYLENDFVIITVANLVKVKGIETLIEAVIKLNNPQIKVLIVGDDTNEYALRIKSIYSNKSFIKFMGKQLDVKPFLALSDLFVIPTKDVGRKEGIPNAPLEAMAMERIVLGSCISGIKDILEEFQDCMFMADNINELAQKIAYWYSVDLKAREKLAKRMRNHVIESFSIEEFIQNHQVLYLNLIQK
ncbi:glycosyltransferase [Mangrovimonas futianensis]|uniref:glycosyltransferase n=1 Tax=Mangrovimonas futianensis TaxID=2895523 RepID=UPI001E2DD142|nr:glycosyltransferase [Mangrovimonas futianensis]MCF1421403.1 glycosyltransferase [Mangrovimonas futianensis]